MKSWHFTGPERRPFLVERDTPQPKPGEHEILVRVHAAGITPSELAWYPTSHTKTGGTRTGAVPSHEFSGEVAIMGSGVAPVYSVGQPVYGMNDWFEEGALAGYCVTQPGWIAPKPQHLDHFQAATVPIGALTAWQGLDRVNLQAGERALIHGGTGAVGIYAIQLARHHGAFVITTASARNLELVKDLGANEVLDYNAVRFDNALRDVDIVFDTVGGEILERSWRVLGPNGRLVTIAASSEGTPDERTKRAFFIVEPDRQQLIEIGGLLDSGALRPVLDTVLPFSQAPDAYEGTVQRQRRGKMAVAVA